MKRETDSPKSVRFTHEEIEQIENYMKEHKIASFSQVVRLFLQKGMSVEEIIKKKNEEIKLLKEAVELLRQGLSEDMHKISEKPCPFLVYVDGEAVCGDIDAPIPSYLKRSVNAQICVICRKKKLVIEREQKVAVKPKRSISKVDTTKAKKIFCVGLGRWIKRGELNQAKCKNCELRTPKVWMECMNKRAIKQ